MQISSYKVHAGENDDKASGEPISIEIGKVPFACASPSLISFIQNGQYIYFFVNSDTHAKEGYDTF